MLYYVSLVFYFFLFAPAIQNLGSENNLRYVEFLLPGLLIITIIGAISTQILYFWIITSSNNLMGYFLSLPYTIEYLHRFFMYNAIFNSIFYVFPIFIVFFFYFSISKIIIMFILTILGGIFLYQFELILVFYFFNSSYVIVLQQIGTPIFSRLSPVFYSLIFIPVFFLPIVYLNPFTWIVTGMRNSEYSLPIILILVFIDFFIYKLIIKYWKSKQNEGILIK